MTEKQAAAPLRRVLIPLLVAVALVVGTILISSSSLIRIEDIIQNRILAGTALKCIKYRGLDRVLLRLLGVHRNAEDSPWAAKVGLLEDHESVHLKPAEAESRHEL